MESRPGSRTAYQAGTEPGSPAGPHAEACPASGGAPPAAPATPAAPARSRARRYAADRLVLARVPTVLGVAVEIAVGVRLSGTGLADAGWARPACAAAVTGAVTASVNIVNDILDVASDAVNKPHRPLPSGRVTRASATRFAAATALAGLLLAAVLGGPELLVATGLLAFGMLYCFRARSTVVWGNLLVAALAGSPIPFGAYTAAGRVGSRAAVAALVLTSFMASFEVLKTLRDAAADRAAGYTTLATSHESRWSIRVFTAFVAVTAAVSAVPVAMGGGVAYLVVMGAAVTAPSVAATVVVRRGDAGAEAILLALRMMSCSWWPGLFALGWLM